jgi:ribonucleotide reductase beta subunit family protein with ferritin-like domain
MQSGEIINLILSPLYIQAHFHITDSEGQSQIHEALLFSLLSVYYKPLYFYGQGKLMQSGEIINLILRDEAIHGVYVGLHQVNDFTALHQFSLSVEI